MRELLAISPLEGRYSQSTRTLEAYFSEFALIRYRLLVEIEWYISLSAIEPQPLVPAWVKENADKLRAIYRHLTVEDAAVVKEIERTTNHDVKALEYFLKQKVAELNPELPTEMVHFACTSEDINNLAYALLLRAFVHSELEPKLKALVGHLGEIARRYKSLVMLSRTHGQPASPTTFGKEIAVFAYRLERQLKQLARQEYLGKLNGAVGNFNAHHFACPEVDWIAHSRAFVESLGLTWNPLTTQIESHDFLAELFDLFSRICTILIDLSQDMWGYISLGCLRQRVAEHEVGSSTMPHKVNPIDFENCEGNLGLARALFDHMARKLPVSRWQRDLSDSTVMRNLGVAFGYLMVALNALERGLSKVEVDEPKISREIEQEQSWEVVAEGIQTLMRRYGVARPYETLKELTRGREVSSETIRKFIDSMPLEPSAKEKLERLSPKTYAGLAQKLVEEFAPAPSGVQNREES